MTSTPSIDGEVEVGEIIGRLRRARGMSLDELARLSGVSASFLSAVERGRSDIALGRLTRVARCFGLDVSSLLGYYAQGNRPHFLSGEERTAIERGEGIDYRRLRLPGVEFELITVTLAPRSAFDEAMVHPGIDILYVAVGEIVLVYDDEDYVMRAGDSGVWSGQRPHAFRNDTAAPAQFIAVVTEPIWDRR